MMDTKELEELKKKLSGNQIEEPVEAQKSMPAETVQENVDTLKSASTEKDMVIKTDLSDAVTAKTEEQEQLEFLSDPENKKNALVLANQIRDVLGNNWFTFNRFIQKTKEDRPAGYQKLKICEMFGYIKTKLGDFSDGKEALRLPMWKVVISKEDHVNALQDMIQYHRNKITQLELEIKQHQ